MPRALASAVSGFATFRFFPVPSRIAAIPRSAASAALAFASAAKVAASIFSRRQSRRPVPTRRAQPIALGAVPLPFAAVPAASTRAGEIVFLSTNPRSPYASRRP